MLRQLAVLSVAMAATSVPSQTEHHGSCGDGFGFETSHFEVTKALINMSIASESWKNWCNLRDVWCIGGMFSEITCGSNDLRAFSCCGILNFNGSECQA